MAIEVIIVLLQKVLIENIRIKSASIIKMLSLPSIIAWRHQSAPEV